MSYSSFESSATKLVAEHLANGLFALTTGTGIVRTPGVGQTDDRSFVHAPSLKMRQFEFSGFGVRLQLNGFEILQMTSRCSSLQTNQLEVAITKSFGA